jgi:hypothetical protein
MSFRGISLVSSRRIRVSSEPTPLIRTLPHHCGAYRVTARGVVYLYIGENEHMASGPSVRQKVLPCESPTGRCRTVPCVSHMPVHLPGLSSSGDRKMCLARPAMSSCNIQPCSDVRKGRRLDAEMTERAVHTRDLPKTLAAAAITGMTVPRHVDRKPAPGPSTSLRINSAERVETSFR